MGKRWPWVYGNYDGIYGNIIICVLCMLQIIRFDRFLSIHPMDYIFWFLICRNLNSHSLLVCYFIQCIFFILKEGLYHRYKHHHHKNRAISNRYLIKSNKELNKVEWLYSFDVHCNSFVFFTILSLINIKINIKPMINRSSYIIIIIGALKTCQVFPGIFSIICRTVFPRSDFSLFQFFHYISIQHHLYLCNIVLLLYHFSWIWRFVHLIF